MPGMINGIRNVLFDLDGTLVDSSETISASIHHALEKMGNDLEHKVPVTSYIGQPLLDIFMNEFGMGSNQAETAIDHYRKYYDSLNSAGTHVYPRIGQVLSSLNEAGFSLFVATVKPTPIAHKVLRDVRLISHFNGIAGASMGSERRDKSSIITHALQKFELEPGQSLMIGDRSEDIKGAHDNGLTAVGVTYGFGTRAELISAKPAHVVDQSREITALLLD
jgi:phosphoglycolate phosphatase